MLPMLQVGPFALRIPPLALLTGLWLALEVSSRAGVRRGVNGDRIYALGLYAVAAFLLGARLGFVVMNPNLYLDITPWTQALLAIVALAPGTEIAWMGVLAMASVVLTFARRWHLSLLTLADSFAPGLTIFAIAIGAANLLSGDYYGNETSLSWGIALWGAKRHPTQILLMVAATVSFVILRRIERQDVRHTPGLLFRCFVIPMGVAVLLIEPLRADSPVIGPGIRTWEVIALVGLVGALAWFAAQTPDSVRKAEASNGVNTV